MTILAVENEKKRLEKLTDLIQATHPDEEVLAFSASPQALAAAREKKIDVAFVDMNLKEMDGLLLGKYLQDLYPSVNLIFLTGRKSDAFDAMAARASGCLLHPAEKESVDTELNELRNPPGKREARRVFAQTFGNFDIFIDGKPVTFKYSRTKEILAVLVNNRGAQTTNNEIITCLWEDEGDARAKSSYLSNLRQDLQNTLTRLKANDIIIKQRGSMAIAVDNIDCDLYDWLEKTDKSRYRYMGDYMNQYSWAEFVHAELDNIYYSMIDEDY